LGEHIDVRAKLRIKKQREARVEQRVALGGDEPGWRLVKVITFEVNQSAEARAHLVVETRERQRPVNAIQKIFG